MAAHCGGYLHWRKERYLLDDAIASWHDPKLWICARSDDCGIYFCAVPFGPANDLAEIRGRTYADDGTTPFTEGRAMIAGSASCMEGGEITCIGVSPSRDAVVVEFSVGVILDASGRTRKLKGGLRCRLVPIIPYELTEYDL